MDDSQTRARASTVQPAYRPLHKYLRDRFAQTVVLTFTQIEDLIGAPLPDVARAQAGWWTNPGTDASPQAQTWIAAERTAEPNLLARTVRFERVAG